MRNIVIPGDRVEGKIDANAYPEGGAMYSMVFGIYDQRDGIARIIPLKGKYVPQVEDYVVGVVDDAKFGGCTVDVGAPYNAFMPTRRDYNHGDVVLAKVTEINEVKSISLGEETRLMGGDIIEISPVRVPRVIGKKNSMLNMLREKTKCDILVGRNGRVWFKGGDIMKAEEAVLLIEREAHTEGLTERVSAFLEKGV
jgi:exosome complex component RRP4